MQYSVFLTILCIFEKQNIEIENIFILFKNYTSTMPIYYGI